MEFEKLPPEAFIDGKELLARLEVEVRNDYEPPFEYHGWEKHIKTGMERIDRFQAFCEENGIKVGNWLAIRVAYYCHDRLLTQTLLHPELLVSYDCAEQLAAEVTHKDLERYGAPEDFISLVDYIILATNPNYPCELPEAKAHCQIDIGNTGDEFDSFMFSFFDIQIERNNIEDLLTKPHEVFDGACSYIGLYLRRGLSLSRDDDFPNRVERNMSQARSMGAEAIRAAFRRYREIVGKTSEED